MYLLENPVLQRELLINLRTARAFALLAGYNIVLGAVVFLAWPPQQHLELTRRPDEAKGLVQLFFLGPYGLASLDDGHGRADRWRLHLRRAVHANVGPLASSTRRWQRGEGSRRFGAREREGRRHGYSVRSIPRSAAGPSQANHAVARRRESRVRQGAAKRDLQPGNADAAAGRAGEHVFGASADGVLLVLEGGFSPLVYRL